MDRIAVTFNLPQELVERAKSSGLLSDDQIERWLADELDRQSRLDRLFGKLDRLSEVDPPLTEDEINSSRDASEVR